MRGLIRVAAAIALLAWCAAAAGERGAASADGRRLAANPLEAWNTHGVRTALQPGTTLRVNATSFMHGDCVEVSWAGVREPALDDLLALYAPADADVTRSAPVKYVWAIQAKSHMASGSGSLRLRLVNMRTAYRFAFLRAGLAAPQLEAVSGAVRPQNPNEPLQLHLALTGRPGEVLAQWTTLNSSAAAVRWGSRPGSYTAAAAAQAVTYTRQDMCGPPANSSGWHAPGLLHRALLTGMQPGARYWYAVGDEAHGWSAEASFLAPPAPGPGTAVSFLAIADLGQAEPDGSLAPTEMLASRLTTDRLAGEVADRQLLLHNGDISYARGFGSIWDAWWDQMQPLTSRIPYMAIPGNHERDWPGSGDAFPPEAGVADSGGECGVPFERRIAGARLSGPDKPWHSFDFGPIHFLQYSTEHAFSPGSEQHAFMAADLAAVNRSRTPWLIVGGHRPYIVDSDFDREPDGDLTVARALQAAFDTLFVGYGVDMTWHGHHHSYQRTCAMAAGRCVSPAADGSQTAPIHLVIGHAGAGLSFNVRFKRPGQFAVVAVEHGYLRVDANGTRLAIEVVRSADGSLMDSLALSKPADWGDRWHARRHPAAVA